MSENKEGMCALISYEGGVQGEYHSDKRTDNDPLRVIIGAHQVIPGVENALFDMEVGEIRVVTIEPSEGYGEYDPEGVQTYPRTMLPDAYKDIQLGDMIPWMNPVSKIYLPVRVIEATPVAVKLDFNHPFAGKTLEYCIKLIDLAEQR